MIQLEHTRFHGNANSINTRMHIYIYIYIYIHASQYHVAHNGREGFEGGSPPIHQPFATTVAGGSRQAAKACLSCK